MINRFRQCSVGALLAITLLITACAATPTPVEHDVQVEDASTGQPVSGADVKAEIDVRYAIEAQTNGEGMAHLSFDPDRLELHDWAKITVTAEGYPATSVLSEVKGPTTVVQLGQPNPTPAATPQTSQGEAPVVEPDPVTKTETGSETVDVTLPDELPPPGPVAEIPPKERANYYDSKPALTIDTNKIYYATIVTSKGDIVVSLDATKAPEHVNNFIFLSKQGFYDGLTFHRVEPGFVIQAGDPLANGQGGPGYTLPSEIGLKHVEGALAMARLPDQVNPERESSGSQFYITLAPTPFLDNQYTVFGKVEKGMDVVKSIEKGDVIKRIIIQP